MKNLFIILFVVVTFFSSYSQDTIYVPGDYSTIQEAIYAAINGDVVLVSEGTYYENIKYKGKAITVASLFLVDGDTSHILNTIINGSQPLHPDSGSVVSFVNSEDTMSVLCGFTIAGGTGTYTASFDDVSGGGIFIYPSGAKICNNIIENNSISYSNNAYGGALIADIDNSSLIIENNIIRQNTASAGNETAGGGIAVWSGGYVLIRNNKIIENTITAASTKGGGIVCNGPSTDFYIISNLIKGNVCNSNIYGGGGLELYNCTPTVKNNLILGNSASFGGGVLLSSVGSNSASLTLDTGRPSISNGRDNLYQYNTSRIQLNSKLENNSIVNNSATNSGGGILIIDSSPPQFMNFIIWGNTASSGSQISGNADVQYSDIEGGYPGTGNIDQDPQFVANNEFFLLEATSPCIDAGNPDPIYFDVGAGGNPIPPAQGSLINDMGHCGGPASLWYLWDWPMPVELISFTATTQYGKVILNWTTATEINNLGFEIERKTNNRENNDKWMLLGFRKGYGTTTEPRTYSFTDDISGIHSNSLSYRLKQIDYDGGYEYSNEVLVGNPAPGDFALYQNYPNPFNPSTTIDISIPVKSHVSLIVFNSIGEQVAQLVEEEKSPGRYEINWYAQNLPSGVYFYQLRAGNFIQTKKMMLLK